MVGRGGHTRGVRNGTQVPEDKEYVGKGWAIRLEGFLEEVTSSLATVGPGGLCKADVGLGRPGPALLAGCRWPRPPWLCRSRRPRAWGSSWPLQSKSSGTWRRGRPRSTGWCSRWVGGGGHSRRAGGRAGGRGGRWPIGGALPRPAPRKLQSGSLSCSGTCLLPMRRACFCETRCGGVGPGPPELGLGEGPGQSVPPTVPPLQVDELERKAKSQQDQLFLTRQELTNTSAELKMRAMQAEGGSAQGPGDGSQGEVAGSPGDEGPRGAAPRLSLRFQSAWSWRSSGPGRAWRTRSSCVPRRCLLPAVIWPRAVPPSLASQGLQMPPCGLLSPSPRPGSPHPPRGADQALEGTPTARGSVPLGRGAGPACRLCFPRAA